MKYSISFLVMVVIVLFCAACISAWGQEKKEPTQREVVVEPQADAPLPTIDLPEFLITGQETIDLPSTSKTSVDEDAKFEGFKPPMAKRTSSKGLSPRHVKTKEDIGSLMSGRVSGGIGLYATPFLEGWFGKKYDSGDLLFHAGFSSSSGYLDNTDWQKSLISVRGSTLLSNLSGLKSTGIVSGGIAFRGESYRLYGSNSPSQQRSVTDLALNAGYSDQIVLASLTDSPIRITGDFGWQGFSCGDINSTKENDFSIDAKGSLSTEREQYDLQISYVGTVLSMPGVAGFSFHSPQWFQLELTGSTSRIPSMRLAVTLQQYLFRGTTSSMHGRLFPGLDINLFIADDISIFGSIGAFAERGSFKSFSHINPYISGTILLEPVLVNLQARVGAISSVTENWRIRFAGEYRSYQDYPIFFDGSDAKIWEVMYLPNVSAWLGELSSETRLSGGASVIIGASVKRLHDEDSLKSVPYVPQLVFSSTYRAVYFNGVACEISTEYQAKRYTDRSEGHANAGFIGVGGKVEYEFLSNLRGTVQLSNLLNQHYYLWNGYRERFVYLSLALTYRW